MNLKYLAVLTACCACLAFGQATITDVTPLTENVQTFERLELALTVTEIPANPFLTEAAPTVTFTAPSGKELSVQAFWYQDYDPQMLEPVGSPAYRIRFTPTESGTWTTDQGFSFDVAESEAHGFLRVSTDNPRYLAFDDATPFFGIGLNLGWASSKEQTLADYERWFDALAAQGANTVRIWMAAWSFGLEWNDTGLGSYTERLDRAWLLDRVFELAEARDIKIILVLINHGQFSETTNPEWAENPYNAALGGPCAEPQCFVTDEQAKDLFKRRLSYTVSRWGYSPSLLAWEWWNEVNWTPISAEQLKPWLTEMTAYLQQVDVYRHLTTHSYSSGAGSSAVWQLDGLDLMQQHQYTAENPLQALSRGYAQLAQLAEKPILFGEFGFATATEDETSLDQTGVHLHNGLWAAALSGYASTAMYWWWDLYVEPLDLWHHYGALARFLEGENLASLEPTTVELGSSELGALALQSGDRALVWVQNRAYSAERIQDGLEDALRDALRNKTQLDPDWRYEPPTVTGQTLTLAGLADGPYLLRWYDPQTGSYLDEEQVDVQGGQVTITVPAFARDLAFKLSN